MRQGVRYHVGNLLSSDVFYNADPHFNDPWRDMGCLAVEMEADILMILTEVPAVAINFGKPDQTDLGNTTAEELEKYAAEGQFGAGSMLPKVQAAVDFVRSAPGRRAIITSLDHGLDALKGSCGTRIGG